MDVAKEMVKTSFMVHNKVKDMQVKEASFEARGVREVGVQDQAGNKMLQIVESAGHVVKMVTCNVVVQMERQVESKNGAIMHLLAEMYMRQE